MQEEFIWSQKYRPNKIDDVIIPEDIKNSFKNYIAQGQIPNILLTSNTPGSGKTTSSYAICHELDIKPLFVNASLSNSIDDIRSVIQQYATTVSVFGTNKPKVVIFDEIDRLSIAAQDSLRALMESVSKNCRFIGTANVVSRMTEPLLSRFTANISFDFSPDELKYINAKMYKRCQEILTLEGISYKNEVLAKLVTKFSPDNRKILNVLQEFSNKYGTIDEGALGQMASCDATVLVAAMKDKKYNAMKEWTFANADKIDDGFYMKLFKTLEPLVVGASIPQIVLVIGEYQKYHSVVPDHVLHFLAMFTEISSSIQFK